MVIRNESERRRAEEQVEYLRSELETVPAAEQQDEITHGVVSGLRMQISDLENKLTEYKRLKEGSVAILTADNFDDIGELIIKARIIRGWSQADLAKALDMEQQQVQRYEKNDWQKISLWRLQEVVEALNLEVSIRAWLHNRAGQGSESLQFGFGYGDSLYSTMGNIGSGVGEMLGNVSVRFGDVLGNVGAGTGGVLDSLSMTFSDTLQTLPEGGVGYVSKANTPRKFRYPSPEKGAETPPTLTTNAA